MNSDVDCSLETLGILLSIGAWH